MTPRIQKFLFAAAAIVLSSGVLCAQESGHKSWLELFESTGFVGYMLVALSIFGTTLVIEHIVSIKRERLAPPQLADELEALIEEENYDQAIDLCTEDGSYMSNLISAALRMRHAGYEEMVGVLEQVAAEEGFKLNAKISYLSLVGNVGPLLGLLGTVTGMISSFQVIENLKAPTPKDLAKGVYESLVNTTIGLFIAILFLTAFFVFKNKVTKMTLSVNLQSVDMLKSMVSKMTAKH
jgi:biopolymer transport protein ExbB